MKRVTYYFDGFNFYYGLREISKQSKDWKKYYWINFVTLCQAFTSHEQELVSVKYFTSPPINIQKRSRQAALLSANKLLNPNVFHVIEGKYYTKNLSCKLCKGTFQTQEEKRTDVNISIHLLMDCVENKTDKLVLITADSDLITTVQTIKAKFPEKDIKVYFPPKRTSAELLAACKRVVYLENNKAKFDGAVMPDIVTGNGKEYKRPPLWI